MDICGIGKHESHEQACEIEHVISDKAIDNLSTQLGDPATCPAEAPIPEGEKETKRKSQSCLIWERDVA